MRHLDLFSGIGGFAIATEMVWDNVEHIFCDNDPFSQAILKKHWPNSLIYGDIKELTQDRIATDTRREYGSAWSSESASRETSEWSTATSKTKRHSTIDILTGGFPCQPFSVAGRRRGTEDDRHLWPEMLRVIRETNPTYVLGENVGGLLTWDGGLVFEQVCTDLESEGYEVGAFVIPAAAIGAPHRRDRVWIVAHAIGSDALRAPRLVRSEEESERVPERDEVGKPGEPGGARVPSNAEHHGLDGAEDPESHTARGYGNKERTDELRQPEGAGGIWEGTQPVWHADWSQVAAELCRMDDGIRTWVDGRGKVRNSRNARLKALGNAIVPQVAAEIMRAIKSVDDVL